MPTCYTYVMANSYKTRLARIDEQIIDIQYLYQRELDREAELCPERRSLLASRGFKYRLDNLYKQRAAARKFIGTAPTKAMNYATELSRRNTEYADACAELEKRTQLYKDRLAAVMLVGMDIDSQLELKGMSRAIGAARSIVSSKNRAVDNWLSKGATAENAQILRISDSAITKTMPKAELILERSQAERERDYVEIQESQPLRLAPAPPLSGEQEIIARAARAYASGASTSVDISTEHPDTYSASFAMLNQQPTEKEE